MKGKNIHIVTQTTIKNGHDIVTTDNWELSQDGLYVSSNAEDATGFLKIGGSAFFNLTDAEKKRLVLIKAMVRKHEKAIAKLERQLTAQKHDLADLQARLTISYNAKD